MDGSQPLEVPALPHDQFAADTKPLRRELLAYCYRLLGSAQDAEDQVQETYLRAWRAFDRFEGRSSLRSWLYTIATNVCLTALEQRRARALPSTLGGPYTGPSRPSIPAAPAEHAWLDPLPDAWVSPADHDPSEALVARESLRLALIASLQHLPARQRAIFILRDVLSFSAAEAAQVLETSEVAIKSGLQRARAQLEQSPPDREQLLAPTDARAQQLLQGYIAAFESADAQALVNVLRADATLEATPFTDWQSGRVRCIELLERYVLGAPGEWRMLPTAANGQPAAVIYRRDGGGNMRGSGLVVLSTTETGVTRVTAFHHDAETVVRFGFPATLE